MLATNLFSLLSFCLLSKKLKIEVYKNTILPIFCMGVKLFSHTEVGTGTEGVSGGRLEKIA
jgi:hypothetical protein